MPKKIIYLPITIEQFQLSQKYNFIQSNSLMESIFEQSFTELELKILCLISKYVNENKFLKANQNTFKDFQQTMDNFLKIDIDKQEFCNFLKINSSNFYRQMKIIIKSLITKSITIQSKQYKKSVFVGIALFSAIACINRKVIFCINPILQIYLQHLNSNFTILSLQYIANMNSIYAIKIYQLLKSYERSEKCSFKITQLKKILGISQLYKDSFSDFKKNVLEIAKKNINYFSDINIHFITKKNRKKIEEIEFKIISKKNHLQRAIEEFKKQMDIYFSRIASMSLDIEHQKIYNYWKNTQKDIVKNQELFELWIKNCTISYNPQSTQELKIKQVEKFGTPEWYNSFLKTNSIIGIS